VHQESSVELARINHVLGMFAGGDLNQGFATLWVRDGHGVFARISYDHESARQLTNETGGTQ
jgi:hypothetical protein